MLEGVIKPVTTSGIAISSQAYTRMTNIHAFPATPPSFLVICNHLTKRERGFCAW